MNVFNLNLQATTLKDELNNSNKTAQGISSTIKISYPE